MADTPPSRAAGVFLALSVVGGAVAGTVLGQPSIGIVAGTGLGVLICLALWLRDRSRA